MYPLATKELHIRYAASPDMHCPPLYQISADQLPQIHILSLNGVLLLLILRHFPEIACIFADHCFAL